MIRLTNRSVRPFVLETESHMEVRLLVGESRDVANTEVTPYIESLASQGLITLTEVANQKKPARKRKAVEKVKEEQINE